MVLQLATNRKQKSFQLGAMFPGITGQGTKL
jgi:hypothetical protein